MLKKKSGVAHRAWNVLRLALLWARKGGVFKRRLMVDLRLLPSYLKSLLHSNERGNKIHYGEREFSFDDTPIIHVKMRLRRPSSMRFRLPHIPCIKPHVDFDFDFEFNNDNNEDDGDARKSFLEGTGDGDGDGDEEIVPCDEEGIDMKAEEFIAKFYEQLKLQRQTSYLQYNEMLNRGAS
uniref:Cotton fiber protein n=1 Tax=Davidia involucrata TaxID=16924 RepID=A0A5B7BSJ9_DAVIN